MSDEPDFGGADSDTSSVFNDAVQEGAGSPSFDVARKLAALAIAEDNPGISGAEAAIHADRSLFKRSISFLVGAGKVMMEDGVDAIIDRAHAYAVAFAKNILPKLTMAACTRLGQMAGAFFGPAGAVIGTNLGAKLGNVLNSEGSELVTRGLDMLRDFAHEKWNAAKAWIAEKGEQLKQAAAARVKAALA